MTCLDSLTMNYGKEHGYFLARSYKNISSMGSAVLQKSSHSHHGGFARSSHRGHSKTTAQSQYFYYGGLHESHHRRSYMYRKVEPKAFCHGSSKAFLHSCNQKASNRCNKALPVTNHPSVDHRYNAHCHNNYLQNFKVFEKFKNNSTLNFDGKKTMGQLNERLSSYLEKVHSLEQENVRLEEKIAQWNENNVPSKTVDHSQNSKAIQELQNRISAVFTNNIGIIRTIDNARTAVEDYIIKYEMELSLRSSVDDDLIGLHNIMEEFNDQTAKLETEVEKLQQEMLKMRRDSEQEINSLNSQLGTRVSVEVEASPSADLSRILSGMREEYEKLMERNLKELEGLFLQRSKKLNLEMMLGSEQLPSAHTEIIDVKHSLQTVEIELQREQYMISTLKDTLVEKQDYYVSELAQLQELINSIESQLDQIQNELKSQIEEHQLLMDKKTHLEQEITTYQYLLDEHGIHVIGHPFSQQHIEQSSSEEQKDEENPKE